MQQFQFESVVLAALSLATTGSAQVTERVSVNSSGVQENLDLSMPPPARFISHDGRFVAFGSQANNLVPGDTNGREDIFIRDRLTRTTERVSVSSAGVQGNGHSGIFGCSISDDGRYVAFESVSNNLISGGTNGGSAIFIRDRSSGTTELVSVDSFGAQANAASFYPSVSADGRYVAYTSTASNLVSGDTNGTFDTFVRDRLNGTTERVSVDSSGAQGNASSYKPEISNDGRFVVFESLASNLAGVDTNGDWDVFLHDRLTGVTSMATVSSSGQQGQGYLGSVSDDGRFVSFNSFSPNLVPGDTNGTDDVFVHDFLQGTTERVSIAWNGAQSTHSSIPFGMSGDGRYHYFASYASNLVPGDTNNSFDTFVRDRLVGTTELVSLSWTGTLGNGHSTGGSISSDGRYVVFMSTATNLVPGDTNGYDDEFIRDRFASGFTSLCDPGLANVIPCSCGNPPSAPGRGCDNSSFTGGAVLSASGIAYLSLDSLVFTTFSEKPSATSILLQGTGSLPNGLVFGQGVRCAGGQLKRMYVKTAVNGSITAPDFNTSDPTVSIRSASLGAPIQPGEPRYYLVFYRDSTVLGGCSAVSTFNATQTGSVTYWP
jgi:Tol biopolymer transport system component